MCHFFFKKKYNSCAEKFHLCLCFVLSEKKKICCHFFFFFFCSEVAAAVKSTHVRTLGPQTVISDVRAARRQRLLQRESIKWSCYGPKQPYWFLVWFKTQGNIRFLNGTCWEGQGKTHCNSAEKEKVEDKCISKPLHFLLGCLFLSSKNWEARAVLNCS